MKSEIKKPKYCKDKMDYIIEFERGVYYAGWEGDPGRTLKIENAMTFKTDTMAKKILQRELENNSHRKFENAKVINKANVVAAKPQTETRR